MAVVNQRVVTLLGCDISNVQGVKIDARGLDFVAAKATQGTTFNDRLFYSNRLLAAKNKQLFAAYHFLEKGDGEKQAQHFVGFVNQHGGFSGIGACVDVELQNRKIGPSLSDVADFLAEFHRLVPGKQIFIYTGKWYWDGHLGNPKAFGNYPLWDSAYIGGSGTPQRLIRGVTPNYFVRYGGWSKHTLRQFSSSGNVNGHHPIDLDEFEGTVEQLAEFFGTSYRPPVVHTKPVKPKNPSTHIKVTGVLNHPTIAAMQQIFKKHRLLKVVDGIMGPNTRKALQRYLGVKDDGFLGPITIKALQKHVGVRQDGIWNGVTSRAIQVRINEGRF